MIKDKLLYEKVKKEIIKNIPKNSAYRSGLIVQEYKKRDGKVIEMNNDDLNRWFKEKWINLTPYGEGLVKNIKDSPPCGKRHEKQKNKSVCRPSKKINYKSPDLAFNYNKEQIKKAIKLKNKGKVIKWNEL